MAEESYCQEYVIEKNIKGDKRMLFSSIVFLFTFLPVTLLVYHLMPGKGKNIVLLLCSLVFYAWGEPIYVILMVLSILFNYVSGIDIERNLENPFKAKRSLAIAVTGNLLILGFFKYYGFFDREPEWSIAGRVTL